MTKGYVIAHLNMSNPDAFMAGYGSKIQGVIEQFGGKIPLSGGVVSYAEKENAHLDVVVEFPDVAAAHVCFKSYAYIPDFGTYSDKGASGVVSGDSGRRAATDGFIKFLQDYP